MTVRLRLPPTLPHHVVDKMIDEQLGEWHSYDYGHIDGFWDGSIAATNEVRPMFEVFDDVLTDYDYLDLDWDIVIEVGDEVDSTQELVLV